MVSLLNCGMLVQRIGKHSKTFLSYLGHGFNLFTGVIVLLGAMRTSKYQRVRKSVLLKTLDAKSKQILKINVLEYLYLGTLGALSGVLLSLLSSQLLAIFVFKSAFLPYLVPFLILFPGIVMLVLVIGMSNSLSIIKHPPLVVLCEELA